MISSAKSLPWHMGDLVGQFQFRIRREWRESPRDFLRGILVGMPVFVFPFSRTFTAFFVFILIASLLEWRPFFRGLLRSAPVNLAVLAIGIPVILSTVALPLLGSSFETLWLNKVGIVFLAGLFAFSTIFHLSRSDLTVQVAGRFISLSVLFWLFDGLIQLGFGLDLFGIPMASRGVEPDRIGIFFANPLTFGYYIPFFSIFPILWFLKPGKFPAVSVIIALAAGAVTFASGSRYAMISYIVGIVLLFALLVPQLTRSLRIWALTLMPAIAILVVGSYNWNESFRSRVGQTFAILGRLDYHTLDYALSYRLEIWAPAWALIRQHWLFGIGPGQFREAMLSLLPTASWHAKAGLKVMHAHQVLLEIALGTGLLGVLCFMLYYAYVSRVLWRNRRLLLTRQAFKLSGTIAFLLMWLPFGTHYNFYGSDQLFFTFYFLALSIGSLPAFSIQKAGP